MASVTATIIIDQGDDPEVRFSNSGQQQSVELDLCYRTAPVATVAFVGLRLAPGDVTTQLLDPVRTPPEQFEALRRELGLDLPIWMQFWNYLTGIFRGDLGASLLTRESVVAIVTQAGGYTIVLALAAFAAYRWWSASPDATPGVERAPEPASSTMHPWGSSRPQRWRLPVLARPVRFSASITWL